MRKLVLEEARLVSMTDAELLDLIGSQWETIKRLDEEMKQDSEIERMSAELKVYKDTHYLDHKRALVLRLRAARALAKVRNLVFPEIVFRNDE